MTTCPTCGRESPDDFGFCPSCGASLSEAATPRDVRKVVTILFCDLIGSTALGDRTDPETLRVLMRRYYETARVVLERHGGTVEKFVGDAVMAVFGIPVATEDDALRAVRAAVELRDIVHGLGLEARIGVNTGEVVAGQGDSLITGDAVNVAARLEQAAAAGEVLLGDRSLGLVRDAVTTEPVELELKGKPGLVVAHRLLALDTAASGVSRRLDRPMIGRLRERDRLRADFRDAIESRTCRLFTLIGPAGIGKSRLVADFLDNVGDAATVARGRALSYGEGITYWPLVEMLDQLGVDPHDAIRSSPPDTQLATRAVLEAAAEQRPLVLVIDDVQWAEPPLLDLIEHLADWSRDAPIFLLCIARPDLLDVRPGWGGGKMNATSILLEPLREVDAAELAEGLLHDVELTPEIRARILEIAEGNPLFLEEMAALAREAPGIVSVPPTIHALLQARLDTLNHDERALIERGSVEGKVFHRGSVTALATPLEREHVSGGLLSLVRKELVRPERSQIAGDDAFRFRHLLIRDTAYESLPKAMRANLHQRFAEWLETHDYLIEQDEIVGYHLEQAAHYLRELDVEASDAASIAERAAIRLGSAGSAAYERGDLHAAKSLLTRAMGLLPEGPSRRGLIPDLVEVLDQGGERPAASELLEELDRGDDTDLGRATVLRLLIDPLSGGRPITELLLEVEVVERVLAEAGDVLGRVHCERARGMLSWAACQAGDAYAAYRRAYELLRQSGRSALQRDLVEVLEQAAIFSGLSATAMRELMDAIEADLLPNAGPLLAASLRAGRDQHGYLTGLVGADEVRASILRMVELLREVGSELPALWVSGFLAVIEETEGHFEAAEERLHEQVVAHERLGDLDVLASNLGEWSLALSRTGDVEGALSAIARGREIVRDEDIADKIMLDLAEGRALAARGDHERARQLVDGARQMGERILMVPLSYTIDVVDAEVRLLGGDVTGAERIAGQLVEACESRGHNGLGGAFRRRFGLGGTDRTAMA